MRRVFEEIKKQKPRYLYVFQDGPRESNANDTEKCALVRAIFNESLDWECELKTYFLEENLGCGKGPATAITWFFENVEQGIIFEDDCLPHEDFFSYCAELLDIYKNNNKISFIGGSSFQNGNQRGDASFYFSAGPRGTCGWATWKRTWEKFDYMLESVDDKLLIRLIKKYFKKSGQILYWQEIYETVKKDRYNESCWDYQFYCSCWKYGMLAAIPNQNLITNIGYDEEGTHTLGAFHPAANITTMPIIPIKLPTKIVLDKKADFYVHKHYIAPYEYGWSGFKRLPFRLNKRIKRFLSHQGSWIRKNNK